MRVRLNLNRQDAISFLGYGASKVVPGFFTFVSIPIWISLYGQSVYGAFSAVWAISLFTTSLGTGWIRQAILRYAGHRQVSWRSVSPMAWGTIGTLPALSILLIMPIGVGLLSGKGAPWLFILLATASVVLAALYQMQLAIIQSRNSGAIFGLCESLRTVGTLAASGLLALFSRQAWVLMAALIAGSLAAMTTASLGIAVATRSRSGRGRPDELGGVASSKRVLVTYWHYGWPLSLWLAGSAVLMYVDRFILMPQIGSARFGHYAAASDLAVRGVGLVSAPIVMFSHVRIMALFNTGAVERAFAYRRMAMKVMAVCLLPFSLLSTWLFSSLDDRLLGQNYDCMVFLLLVLASSAWQICLLVHNPLEMQGKLVLMFFFLPYAVIATLTFDLLTVHAWAERGVALGFLLGACVYAASSAWLGWQLSLRKAI